MAEIEDGQCQAVTKQGDPCRNRAVVGERYCGVHLKRAASPAKGDAAQSGKKLAASTAPQAPAVAPEERAKVEAVAQELNKLADEVKKREPDYAPPPFSHAAMVSLLKSNAEQIAAYLPTELVKDIIRNLEGTKKEDLLDPETWKGLWYILNYSFSAQARGVLEEVAKRLSAIPGMDMVVQLTQSVMESPRDLLSIDTWKGAAVILNAAVQAQVSALRRKVLGGEEE